MDEYSGVGDTERARRWPERGRAGGGQGLCRGGVAPLPWWGWPGLGFAHHVAEMAVQGISE
jgi:hypothetical protein